MSRTVTAAFIGAIAASVGDLLMLWVGNAQRSDLALASPPEIVLWLGCLLGVVGLPVYGYGYVRLQRTFTPDDSLLARALGGAGFAAGIVGACVHGYTAFLIKQGLDAPVASAAAPAEAVLASGPLLLSLWALTFVCILAAVFAWVTLRIKAGRGTSIATLANPLVLTIVLVVVGGTGPLLEAFLLPAAPNLAHVLFFGLLLGENLNADADAAASRA
jgi:hypothetical protein